MKNSYHISILGGGIAGLAAAYYARQYGQDFAVYEASSRVGGNCITYRSGDFMYDSGAHRLHDKDPEVTAIFQELIGEDLKKIDAPSHIYHDSRYIAFPLRAGNLLSVLGPLTVLKAGMEVISERLFSGNGNDNFETFATRRYGKTLASLFLLNYSEKLWGAPGNCLSPVISGRRLKGLDIRTFISESLLRRSGDKLHMEGSFYYPTNGIGVLAESLGRVCGSDRIRTRSSVTRIFHDNNRIRAIEINGSEIINIDRVISTLPLDLFLKLLDPPVPAAISEVTGRLKFRDTILSAIFLDRESVSDDATIYFPSEKFPFTRIYEPRNRSRHLSPEGKTSLVAEIPCSRSDSLWKLKDNEISDVVSGKLADIGCFQKKEIIGTEVRRMSHAYPVLESDYEKNVSVIFDYINNFSNLGLSGRNGKFVYAWIHDMMRFGRDEVERLIR